MNTRAVGIESRIWKEQNELS